MIIIYDKRGLRNQEIQNFPILKIFLKCAG